MAATTSTWAYDTTVYPGGNPINVAIAGQTAPVGLGGEQTLFSCTATSAGLNAATGVACFLSPTQVWAQSLWLPGNVATSTGVAINAGEPFQVCYNVGVVPIINSLQVTTGNICVSPTYTTADTNACLSSLTTVPAYSCVALLHATQHSIMGGTGGGTAMYPTGYVPPIAAARAKLEQGNRLQVDVGVNLANYATANTGSVRSITEVQCPDGCPPSQASLGLNVYPQTQYWNCGPGAVYNVLVYINGSSPSMDTLGDSAPQDMHTNAVQETDEIDAPARALNFYQQRNTYQYTNVGSPTQLLSYVTDDIANWNSPVVENVATQSLYWFHNHVGQHFDVISGYDHYRGGHLDVLEQYDGPTWMWANSAGETTPDPAQIHYQVPLSDVYTAVAASASGNITW